MTIEGTSAAYPLVPLTGPGVPPPPGPGVQPPFVAPPTDGTKQRRWLAAGLAGGAALILCVGGLFGIGGLVVFGGQMILDQSKTAVVNYLTAVRDGKYADAYNSLCQAEKEKLTKPQFERALGSGPRISSFTVASPIETNDLVLVPATMSFTNGSSQTVKYVLEQNTSTGDIEVCGQQD
jgi:hypothetical protein